MSDTINQNLFNNAKTAAAKLCFDASVDNKTCVRQAHRLMIEIEKMVLALDPKKDSYYQIVEELRLHCDVLRHRLYAVEQLAACYRMQRQPTEKLFLLLDKTEQALQEIGDQDYE